MKPPDPVTASEIAEWVYCPESWRLAKTGQPTVNQPVRDVGTAHHDDLVVVETAAGGSVAIGHVLIVLAALALAAAWMLSR